MKNSIKWSLVAILSTILIAGASCEKSIDDEGGSKYYEYFLSTYQSMDLALETGLEDEQGKIYSIQIGSGENVQFFTSPDTPTRAMSRNSSRLRHETATPISNVWTTPPVGIPAWPYRTISYRYI